MCAVPEDDKIMDLVSSLLETTGNDRYQLLQVLYAVQRHHGCIPAPVINRLADRLGLGEADIRGVISFYSFLHEESRGSYEVLFSDNITDRMLGSVSLRLQLCEYLGIAPDEYHDDGLVFDLRLVDPNVSIQKIADDLHDVLSELLPWPPGLEAETPWHEVRILTIGGADGVNCC